MTPLATLPTGLVKKKTYADAQHVDYTYNALGRVATRAWARSGGSVTTTYAWFDGLTTQSSDVSHRTQELRAVTYSGDGGVTSPLSFTYNRNGAMASVSDSTGQRTFSYRTSGTADLQLDTETLGATFYGTGRTLKPTYETINTENSAQRVNGIELENAGTDVVTHFTFDAANGSKPTGSRLDS